MGQCRGLGGFKVESEQDASLLGALRRGQCASQGQLYKVDIIAAQSLADVGFSSFARARGTKPRLVRLFVF